MDKSVSYKEIVLQVIEEIAAMAPTEEEIDIQKIIDEERGHYLLFSVGWEKSRWIYGSFVHIDIKSNGKVWLQHDGTDFRVAEKLVDKGIPKSNIVLGFHAPHARKLMDDYAVA